MTETEQEQFERKTGRLVVLALLLWSALALATHYPALSCEPQQRKQDMSTNSLRYNEDEICEMARQATRTQNKLAKDHPVTAECKFEISDGVANGTLQGGHLLDEEGQPVEMVFYVDVRYEPSWKPSPKKGTVAEDVE